MIRKIFGVVLGSFVAMLFVFNCWAEIEQLARPENSAQSANASIAACEDLNAAALRDIAITDPTAEKSLDIIVTNFYGSACRKDQTACANSAYFLEKTYGYVFDCNTEGKSKMAGAIGTINCSQNCNTSARFACCRILGECCG